MTTRGLPQLYSGDEIGMKGGEDPDNRRDFPGGFPGAQADAFTAAGRTPEQQQMFSWVSKLAKVRQAHPALACGAEQVLASDADWMVYLRDAGHAACAGSQERVLVAVHRGAKADDRTVPVAQTWMAGCRVGSPELGATGSTAAVEGDTLKLHLQGDDVVLAACR